MSKPVKGKAFVTAFGFFCFGFFLLVFAGPGPYSLDRLRSRTTEAGQ